MPPGHEPMPSAHTSCPPAGRRSSPVKMTSRKTVPQTKTSTSGAPSTRSGARGSYTCWGTVPLSFRVVVPDSMPQIGPADRTHQPARDDPATVDGVRLAMLGGGGFRTPLVHGALLRDRHERRVDEVWLHDVDAGRLATIGPGPASSRPTATRTRRASHAPPPSTRPSRAVDFVFSAIRVGGLAGRTADERVALDLGAARAGDDRSGRAVVRAAHRARGRPRRGAGRRARPGRLGHQLHQPGGAGDRGDAGGPRRPGRRDLRLPRSRWPAGPPSPSGSTPRGRPSTTWGSTTSAGCAALHHDGRDVLPDLLADDALLGSLEEGRLFGADWVRTLGALPNEYL